MTAYAGSLYDTPEEAWVECALDYITSGGNNSREDTESFIETCHRDPVMVLSEMVIDGWAWPAAPDLNEQELAIEEAITQWDQQL